MCIIAVLILLLLSLYKHIYCAQIIPLQPFHLYHHSMLFFELIYLSKFKLIQLRFNKKNVIPSAAALPHQSLLSCHIKVYCEPLEKSIYIYF